MAEQTPHAANVVQLSGKYQRRGTVGAVRFRGDGRGNGSGATTDRWNRNEVQVREQRELAEKIADAIDACRERAEEIEPGKTFGPRNLQRLEVAARGFRRLVQRDSLVLDEFEAYFEAWPSYRPRKNGAAA